MILKTPTPAANKSRLMIKKPLHSNVMFASPLIMAMLLKTVYNENFPKNEVCSESPLSMVKLKNRIGMPAPKVNDNFVLLNKQEKKKQISPIVTVIRQALRFSFMNNVVSSMPGKKYPLTPTPTKKRTANKTKMERTIYRPWVTIILIRLFGVANKQPNEPS